jgi:glutaredoxin 3
MKHVTIYSKHDCPWCDKAKQLLENYRVPYQELIYNVDFTKDDLQQVLSAVQEHVSPVVVDETIKITVPQIFVGDTRIGGYEDLTKVINHGMLESMMSETV